MPVFSSHLPDYKREGVCRKIRDVRVGHGLTLKQLANKVGVSEAKLSNIENDRVTVDLAELAKIADALEVPVAAFFPRSRVQHYLIRRGADVASEQPTMRDLMGPEPGPGRHHNPVWPLAELFVGKHIEPLRAQMMPLPDQDIHFIAHDHEEFMFVLRGQVETLLKTNEGLVKERLDAGDCLYFRSNLPHCHRSATSQPAETLTVIYSLRGPIDPDDGELGSAGRRFYRRGVYSDVIREASEKIGLLRRSHGTSLAELARDVGVGVRQLTEIERGERSVDVDLLLELARKFRRPIEYFLSTTLDTQPLYMVQRSDDIKTGPVYRRRTSVQNDGRNQAHIFRPLAPGFRDRGMFPFYVQLIPTPPEAISPHEHHGQEFVYVLDGEVELVTFDGDKQMTEVLRAGDSLFLESSVPHALRGRSHNPYASTSAQVIDVFWSPLGEDYLFSREAAAFQTVSAG